MATVSPTPLEYRSMDAKTLHRSLQRVVDGSVSIVLGKSTDVRTFGRDTICIMPHVLDTCPSTVELSEAFRKRLRGLKSPYSIEQLVAVGVACVCSDGYTVNHHTVKLLKPTQILSIWGHIETLCVSSSLELSVWLNRSVNRRSQSGYRLAFQDDEGMPSFKLEPSTTLRKTASYKGVAALSRTKLPLLYDRPATIVEAAVADSVFLSTSRIYSNMSPLYEIASSSSL